jgi:hypothetical protein
MRLALAFGILISAGVCGSAMAQSAGMPAAGAKQARSIDLIADILYDSNVAHSSEALAAARGIKPEDEMFRPKLHFDIVQPVGRQSLFLSGFTGYDFHKYNKQLDRINAALTAGASARAGPCQATVYGTYQAAQSDPADTAGVATVRNLLTTAIGAATFACGQATGLQETLSYQHQTTENSDSFREEANHRGDSVSASVSYGNASLGSLGLVGSYSRTEFPNRIVGLGVTGDSFTSESLGINYQRAFGAKLKGALTVSDTIVKRGHSLPGAPASTSGLNYSANGSYAVNNALQLSLLASRAYQPSNRPGKLYDLITATEFDANYRVGTRIAIILGAVRTNLRSNVDSSVVFLLPTDLTKTAYFGTISYKAGRRGSVALEFRHEDETTNLPAFDYSDNRVTLSLGISY